MKLLLFIILYFIIGCILDEVARGDESIPRSYFAILMWPLILFLATGYLLYEASVRIFSEMKKTFAEVLRDIKEGKEDDLDTWNI